MEQKLIVILGPNRSLKTTKFEHIANARTTAYKISRGNNFIYSDHSSEPLNLQMRYFVVQIFHKAGDPVTINLTMKTAKESEETIFSFSTSNRATQQRSSSNMVNVKLATVPPDEWVNVCIDLEYTVIKNLPDSAFVSLTNFEINPTCLIRFVFTVPTPLRPENNGIDLPNKTRFQGLKSQTVLYAENVPKTSKPRNPGRSQGLVTKQTKSPLKQKRPKTAASNEKSSSRTPETKFENSLPSKNKAFDDEEEDSDDDAFIGSEPVITNEDINVQNGLPENEEEELELVYVEALKCYYCPNNQQYYQIDD